ncbi:hypothetical protein TNIN_474241 [Trichonephila inaurata madagascariensis]|uniref:Uncharacterized protein n=1 Tax=Trichonephila inaurata madagascariensis TaxID=2747483 RepID=A0A8X6XFZ1_9ARAC|nr:hypothetical protein TNIN_474241 [Trichonephila inaurata madagascariensis]
MSQQLTLPFHLTHTTKHTRNDSRFLHFLTTSLLDIIDTLRILENSRDRCVHECHESPRSAEPHGSQGRSVSVSGCTFVEEFWKIIQFGGMDFPLCTRRTEWASFDSIAF